MTSTTISTLLQYVTTHDELYRRIGDHNITLPGAVQGWHLLRRSNLSKDQRQLVMTQAPETRQLLADRISYGKTKFTWDPLYTAAKKKKKKKLSERNQSRDEFTSPNLNSNSTSTFKPTSINNNGEKRKKPMFDEKIDEETCDADPAMNYQETEQCSYFADGGDKIEYCKST